jgi:transglutaminase-like putative cysteine protease
MRLRFVLVLLAAAVGVAAADPWKGVAGYEFEYRVPLAGIAGDGGRVRLWVPYPAENADQRVLGSDVESPWPWRITEEANYGNRMIYTEGDAKPGMADFVLRVKVERSPSDGIRRVDVPSEGPLSPARYTSPDRMVPLAGLISEIADKESRGLRTDAEKVQAFYDYVYRTMSYDKGGTGWGRGDAIWACTNKRGNCTDFHSLFIGMLRSKGIPARFLIGFPIPETESGDVGGYHCWAEFFDESRGWLPVDASEAKKKGLKDAYFGALPNDRIEFTSGRDITLEPPQSGEPLNYFIYPHAEIAGRPAGDVRGAFRFRRLPAASAS